MSEVPQSSSNLSPSSNYGDQFLNISSNTSLVGTVKKTTEAEFKSLLDIQIQQEIPSVLSAPLLDVLVLVIPLHTTPTPLITPLPTPPSTSEAPTITTTVPEPLPAFIQRLSNLERKFKAWTKIDHFEAIEESMQANIINEVKNQLPNFLPKAASDFATPKIKSTIQELLQQTLAFLAQSSSTPGQSSHKAAESLSEYELKTILFDKIDKSRSYMTRDKHQELYNALLNSLGLDDAIASGAVDHDKVLRKRDHGDDQDPNARSDQGKKKRRKGKDFKPSKDKVQTSSSYKCKTQSKPSLTGKTFNADAPVQEPVHEASMDVEEPIMDDVVNDPDQPQDDAAPRKDNATWFKQPPRPETPDPE
ncbi:hypothetical protein Tco_0977651 [Tanacetum coccineum]|uniref:Uncharacterized protein n=1 Tax=Tanacetum coccineum TaxID=301880 RepID=A0ABQ5EKX8_9ASTR